MHFFDPLRKRLGGPDGQPMFCPPEASVGLSVLPALNIIPRPNGTIEVSAFLMTGAKGSSRFTCEIPLDELPRLVAEWTADPEQTAKDRLGWKLLTPAVLPGQLPGASPAPRRPQQASSQDLLTLDDLKAAFEG